jgi:hypothetical protein
VAVYCGKKHAKVVRFTKQKYFAFKKPHNFYANVNSKMPDVND